METSPSVFPFVSAFLILSESIIYYSLEGVFLWRSIPVHSLWYPERGAGFDRPQVTSFLRYASSYCLGSRLVVPGLEPDVRYRLPLFSVAFSGPTGDRVGSQVSGAEALIVRLELAVFPLSMCPPFSQHCNPCHRGTRGACAQGKEETVYRLAADRGPGYLQCTTCASTSSSFSHPA